MAFGNSYVARAVVTVVQVLSGGQLGRAGVLPDDDIIEAGGQALHSTGDLVKVLEAYKHMGKRLVSLTFNRRVALARSGPVLSASGPDTDHARRQSLTDAMHLQRTRDQGQADGKRRASMNDMNGMGSIDRRNWLYDDTATVTTATTATAAVAVMVHGNDNDEDVADPLTQRSQQQLPQQTQQTQRRYSLGGNMNRRMPPIRPRWASIHPPSCTAENSTQTPAHGLCALCLCLDCHLYP